MKNNYVFKKLLSCGIKKMAISTLIAPNSLDLFCQSITVEGPIISQKNAVYISSEILQTFQPGTTSVLVAPLIITPGSVNSLINFKLSASAGYRQKAGEFVYLRVKRGSTIVFAAANGIQTVDYQEHSNCVSVDFIDLPGTTGPVTYTVEMENSGTWQCNMGTLPGIGAGNGFIKMCVVEL